MADDKGPTTAKKPGSQRKREFLKDGCYYIRYIPSQPDQETFFFEGTMRVLRVGAAEDLDPNGILKAGGDLYSRLRNDPAFDARDAKQWKVEGNPDIDPALLPNPEGGIPIFPRALYRYYLEVTDIEEDHNLRLNLEFAVHQFQEKGEWRNPGKRTALLKIISPHESALRYAPYKHFNAKRLFLAGDVLDEKSESVGTLSMLWISPGLRRARVHIRSVKGLNISIPGTKKLWQQKFEEIGWSLDVDTHNDLENLAGKDDVWTAGALQQALYATRVREIVGGLDPARQNEINSRDLNLERLPMATIQAEIPELATRPDPLDNEWIYHLLCVQKLPDELRGLMFDTGSDSLNLPREGAAVAAFQVFDMGAVWGSAGSQTLQSTQPKSLPSDVATLIDSPNAYFRVAMHEQGHAMGLDHNYLDDGFMNTSDSIADDGYARVKERLSIDFTDAITRSCPDLTLETVKKVKANLAAMPLAALVISLQSASKPGPAPASRPEAVTSPEATPPKGRSATTKAASSDRKSEDPYSLLGNEALERVRGLSQTESPPKLFPDNVLMHYHPDDKNRLRFGPDIAIRPGTNYDNPGPLMNDESSAVPAQGLKLDVVPLMESVPLGAPVRVNLRLKNITGNPMLVPASLSLKTGMVEGKVQDPQGTAQSFWPLKRAEDVDSLEMLSPGEIASSGLTLLRGPKSALFPIPGDYRIKVKASWDLNGARVFVEGQAAVHVTEAVDANHRSAARTILSTPDTLLSIAIIGDQFTEGNAAIEVALKNPVLEPHFAVVESKRLLVGAPGPADLPSDRRAKACALLEESTVMSFDEMERICEMLHSAYRSSPDATAQVQLASVHRVMGRKMLRMLVQEEIEPARVEAALNALTWLRDARLKDSLQTELKSRARVRRRRWPRA